MRAAQVEQYNKDNISNEKHNELNGGIEHVSGRVITQGNGEQEHTDTDGQYRGNRRQNQGNDIGQVGRTDGISEGIPESDLRNHEIGLSGTERRTGELSEVNRPVREQGAGQSFDGNAETGDRVYEKPKMMESWDLNEALKQTNPTEYEGLMNNLVSSLKEITIKEVVEI